MAALTINTTAPGTSAPDKTSAVVPAAGGDTLANGTGFALFVVENNNGGSITATVTSNYTVPANLGSASANAVTTIANGETAFIGPFNRNVYNDSTGLVAVVCSATSGVRIMAIAAGS